jgi:hypothetical protein
MQLQSQPWLIRHAPVGGPRGMRAALALALELPPERALRS